ncbi:hypothetical protein JTB14_008737 [Gonioctena quinquepunctata]|nr:hypothetical protein JTB14_008737 [Gonioctena quinquepunctata]
MFGEIDVIDVYGKDTNLLREDVLNLMEWIEKQPHLPEVTELQVALFLHSCSYSNEMAKVTIDKYFTIKTLCPEVFGNRDPRNPVIQSSIEVVLFMPLPKQTPDGDLVLFVKMMDLDPKNYIYAAQIKCFDMITLFHLHKYGPANGIVIVFDMKGFTLGHFLKVNVVYMKTFLFYLQEGMPIKFKSIHFINIVPFMDRILAMMRPFMKKQVADAFIMHTQLDTLFERIPKEIFPEEYGGACESTKLLHERYKSLINENAELFKFQDSQIVDESRRPEKDEYINEVFGIDGTFKKLQ